MHDVVRPADLTTAPALDIGPLRRLARNLFPFVVVGSIWETVAHLHVFPVQFFPTLESVGAVFVQLTLNGILPHHAFDTVLRLAAGFALAALVGVAIGVFMGRSRRAEDYLLPLVSIAAPIPGLAYAPLFLLWFGPGDVPTVLLVGFVSMFPIIYNAWIGVKAVKDIWLRSAQAMGADQRRLFRHVILPGALPYIVTGLRLGLAQAWRILVAVEMLAAVPWGLGWMIFGAQEFLNTDVMLAGIAVIALIGLGLEKLVFEPLEEFTAGALGHDGVMTPDRAKLERYVTWRRGATSIIVAAAIYEAVAQSGYFAAALMPTPGAVARTFLGMLLDGSMFGHAAVTLYRVLCGFGLAVMIGLPLGVLMGRFRPVENFVCRSPAR